MKPENLQTKIFLDSGSPHETKKAIDLLGFLDGQTTNPTYWAKSEEIQERLQKEGKFAREEIYEEYKKTVQEISKLIPKGSVSVEVYADKDTKADTMFEQGKEMFSWIPNAHIKYPTTSEGLEAAERSIAVGMRVNMTLCFSQEQAAAVYAATKGAGRGDVYVSPFIGRLDDRGENGMDLIKNIVEMYKHGDGHVMVLTASLRNLDHLYAAIAAKTDIITGGFTYLQKWTEKGVSPPEDDFTYNREDLKGILYEELDLGKEWSTFDIHHELTDSGMKKFSDDWNALIKT